MASLKVKKRLSYFIVGLFFFIGGIEYAVILPTMWLYIKTDFNAPQYMLGILLSGYSFAAIIAGPVMGRWSDKYRRPKLLLLVGILFQMGGNIMYFMGISEWFLLGSRLVCGVGGGAEAVLMGEVTRSTEEDKRTGIISLLVAIRQTGLLIGPGLNLFLREFDFYVSSFHVNKYNIPGAFMTCVWMLLFLTLLFLYTDLHKLVPPSPPKHNLRQSDSYKPSPRVEYDENLDDIYRQISESNTHKKLVCGRSERSDSQDPDDLMESAENFIGQDQNYAIGSHMVRTGSKGSVQSPNIFEENHADVATNYEQLENTLILPAEEPMTRKASQEYIDSTEGTLNDYLQGRSRLKFLYHEYIREEIIAVLAVQFNGFFNQLALETMATPLSDKLLDWGEMENSIMYCLAGVEIISVFILVRWLSRRLQDRLLMLIGVIVLTVANCYLIYVIPLSKPHSPHENVWKFSISLILDMFALPFLIASSVSLYSKVTKKETQGLSMGIRRSVVGVATILAPLWAGSTIPWPYIMFGVMLGLLAMSLTMLTVSYTKLVPLSDIPANRAGLITSSNYSDENSERQPLL